MVCPFHFHTAKDFSWNVMDYKTLMDEARRGKAFMGLPERYLG